MNSTGMAVGVLAAVFTITAISFLDDVQSEPSKACVTQEDKDKIVRLSERGVDAGFQQHVAKLFTIWVQDNQQQPKRAKTGIQNGIEAYTRAKADIALWLPTIC